jgi:hypothetical protein
MSSERKRALHTFIQLGAWLENLAKDTPVWRGEKETIHWYMGFVFALDQLLSLRHAIAMLPGEKISRENFMQSWKHTATRLGL